MWRIIIKTFEDVEQELPDLDSDGGEDVCIRLAYGLRLSEIPHRSEHGRTDRVRLARNDGLSRVIFLAHNWFDSVNSGTDKAVSKICSKEPYLLSKSNLIKCLKVTVIIK